MTKPNKPMPPRTHRKFDPDFKRQAVANWLSSGKSAEVIAHELGINSNLLYAWRKRFAPEDARRAAQGAKPSVADLQAQLDAARRELAHVREQRDILKKRWASSPIPSPTLRTDRRDEKPALDPNALRLLQRVGQWLL